MQLWVQEMLRHLEENQTLLKEIDKELRYAPKGDLQISHYRGAARYYRNRRAEGKGKSIWGRRKLLFAMVSLRRHMIRNCEKRWNRSRK